MNWIPLKDEAGLEIIKMKSADQPQLIFKHSTRCGTSSMIKNRLEKSGTPAQLDFHFLDLVAHRALSNKIAEDFKIRHESPQVLLIKNGECVYDESHNGISMDEIIENVKV
ncbi:MAG: bacillithiol system redox-active protein YtxJ [Chitinophagaceae bacterium]